jgi:hypothetical protein
MGATGEILPVGIENEWVGCNAARGGDATFFRNGPSDAFELSKQLGCGGLKFLYAG